jgi:hypothetical protein
MWRATDWDEMKFRETLKKSRALETILPMHGKVSSGLGDLKSRNASTGPRGASIFWIFSSSQSAARCIDETYSAFP